MDSFLAYLGFAILLVVPLVRHLRRTLRREAEAKAAAERGQLSSEGPKAQHPRIDLTHCIGCGACVEVCPEGDVLAVIAGKAAIVNGHKCIGHGLCADACPVGAIEIVMASPTMSAEMPQLSLELETNVPNLFIVGELGGLALIKNAVNQGRDCVDAIIRRLPSLKRGRPAIGVLDVCIVGAGPGGISASLRALQHRLSYVTLEQDEMGGTVSKYPRQKLVMTSPVEFPLYGKFKKLEIRKEELIKFWAHLTQKTGLQVNTMEKVESITRDRFGVFEVVTAKRAYRAHTVVLALGRRGTPRRLGVKGEELSKVMYSLIEADAYTDRRILVVGGGDSAVEAAMGLAYQKGNKVTISYRREGFSRLKERNAQRVRELIKSKRLEVLFNSKPVEIREQSVLVEVNTVLKELANDYVWIFAGGEPPNEFLQKVGVVLGPRDLSTEAGAEARLIAKAG